MERDPEWWEHLVKHSQPRIGTEMQQRCENHAREMQEEGVCGKGEHVEAEGQTKVGLDNI